MNHEDADRSVQMAIIDAVTRQEDSTFSYSLTDVDLAQL